MISSIGILVDGETVEGVSSEVGRVIELVETVGVSKLQLERVHVIDGRLLAAGLLTFELGMASLLDREA